MLKSVIEFNRVRNGFNYDESLEIEMFNEECGEFFNAITLAERIDAFIDMEYVRLGTVCKLAYNGFESKLPYDTTGADVALNVLRTELGKDFERVIEQAQRIVCECNAMKISKLDKNGKVMKQKDLRDATKEIANLLSQIEEETKKNEED